jgi:hypothetical protein
MTKSPWQKDHGKKVDGCSNSTSCSNSNYPKARFYGWYNVRPKIATKNSTYKTFCVWIFHFQKWKGMFAELENKSG